jgi:ADP-ribosylation factor-like protein 2|tara:strand:- start:5974 stop:6564 length:591 start_codon:yes stop_codon:yes gene_type:complete
VKRKEREIRVLVVGLDNAGKTTIVKKINGEDISKISPTLGFNISSLHLNDYRLNVWDVGGQKTLRTFWRNYFEKTDALVWVVDSTDVARLQDCKNELDVILKEEKLVDASLLVLANKQDVEGAMSGRDIAEALGLVSIGSSNSVSVSSSEVLSGMTSNSSKRRWRVQKCSATTGDGILDGFEFITEDVGSRMFTLD